MLAALEGPIWAQEIQIKKSLGQEAIRVSTPEITITCKDIDETATKEEVQVALERQFGRTELQVSAVKREGNPSSRGSTQTVGSKLNNIRLGYLLT